jgi:triacylglycerol esterase/lipase EstA (alpha/beta hydrolase family)
MSLPTVIVPGYLAAAGEYSALESFLNEQGIDTYTVPLTKWDWVPTIGGRSMVPILRKIDLTVQKVRDKYGDSLINVVGHSAGGWVTRIYLGEQPYDIHGDVQTSEAIWSNSQFVQTLITLGTPHTSNEYWTRKNLNFVNNNYPGAFYSRINYVCLAGKSIYGEQRLGQWLAYNSYKLTCGEGNSWGDGITPIIAAHLQGAVNLVLEGVRHAPNKSQLWYGSPEVVKEWLIYL